jgi:hypothetical protein
VPPAHTPQPRIRRPPPPNTSVMASQGDVPDAKALGINVSESGGEVSMSTEETNKCV